MILGERELRWQQEVTTTALRHGWTTYAQTLANQRQGLPSVVLVKPGHDVILAYLRTTVRSGRRPDVDRTAVLTGACTVLWTPSDRSEIERTLMGTGPDKTRTDARESTSIGLHHNDPYAAVDLAGASGKPRRKPARNSLSATQQPETTPEVDQHTPKAQRGPGRHLRAVPDASA